jgi:hypothetical protein
MSKQIENINAVSTKEEIQLIFLDYRFNIENYNNQSMENFVSIESMFDTYTQRIMRGIQSKSHKKFGSSGMVLYSQILTILGLPKSHPLID